MAACGVGVSHNKVCVAGFNLPRFGWGLFFGLVSFVLFFSVPLSITALLPPATYRELNWQSWCTQ